jgi:hypothetical protein
MAKMFMFIMHSKTLRCSTPRRIVKAFSRFIRKIKRWSHPCNMPWRPTGYEKSRLPHFLDQKSSTFGTHILRDTRKHLTGHLKFEKKSYEHWIIMARFRVGRRRPGPKDMRFGNAISLSLPFILEIDYRLYITWIIHHQIWEYKAEEELHLGVRELKRLNPTAVDCQFTQGCKVVSLMRQPPFTPGKFLVLDYC